MECFRIALVSINSLPGSPKAPCSFACNYSLKQPHLSFLPNQILALREQWESRIKTTKWIFYLLKNYRPYNCLPIITRCYFNRSGRPSYSITRYSILTLFSSPELIPGGKCLWGLPIDIALTIRKTPFFVTFSTRTVRWSRLVYVRYLFIIPPGRWGFSVFFPIVSLKANMEFFKIN